MNVNALVFLMNISLGLSVRCVKDEFRRKNARYGGLQTRDERSGDSRLRGDDKGEALGNTPGVCFVYIYACLIGG